MPQTVGSLVSGDDLVRSQEAPLHRREIELLDEWPLTEAEPLPVRPYSNAYERLFVAENRGSRCSPKAVDG
ncbi:hypothetical protein B0G69_7526 [Paraburkholderia sp. RAU2J]|nr:hypothetical protein B0G69_7526 [Paraburkholderia sp. RAU2J]